MNEKTPSDEWAFILPHYTTNGRFPSPNHPLHVVVSAANFLYPVASAQRPELRAMGRSSWGNAIVNGST